MSDQFPAEDLEDLYETAPCGYVSVSPDGRIVRANRTLSDWLGWKPGELLGKPLNDILAFGGRIAVETHLAPLLRMQGHVHEIALDLLTAGGEKIPTIANAAEKRDTGGGHLFTRLTLFKAVDRRAYERSLLDAKARAERESRAHGEAALAREQFIAVLGHDLRNPVAALAAGIRLLRQREQISDRGRSILSEMEKSAARASNLIDEVLDLARGSLGGGLIVERNADAPLTPVLEQVIAEMRVVAPEHAIEARLDIDEPLHCDRGRIGQLASNLLANAVTHGAVDQPIRFEAASDGEHFVLSVANAGEPIPEQARGRLFQPFFRGDARPSRNGLGLGLFIASEIAKAHGGSLDVSSTAEETRFTFTMPSAVPSAD
ncbi:PAS domain-containing sensor histidine kinase [Sphingomonas segetis]|uniref:PAS domain-containing sensor histidine kinase n=1 Tax=Sphingomonas segetis TaxID=1104779 RepID=UPI0012D2ECFA|nr:PAS domain-containing sensor histidine kinase [Sphingomonas segetis]